MSKKRLAVFLFMLIAAIASNYLIWTQMLPDGQMPITLQFDVKCDKEQLYQIFYSANGYGEGYWLEQNSCNAQYQAVGENTTIQVSVPADTNYIRLDFGAQGAVNEFQNMKFICESESVEIDFENAVFLFDDSNGLESFLIKNGVAKIVTTGTDPYLAVNLQDCHLQDMAIAAQQDSLRINKIALCAALDILLLGAFLFLNKFKTLPMEVYRSRRLVMDLAKNDFKTRYAGSYLGIIWAFVQPIITIAVYSFVFQVGFRSGAVMECPFVLWLMAGLVPWFFFSDALNGGTAALIEYSYLVKKVVFKISVLPIVKIISALFVHVFFVFITIVLFALFGYLPDLYVIQVVYYSFAMFVFVLALSYITCSIVIFFRDLGQIINIFLQVGIWLTPIMWQETMLPENFRWILKINPIYYIVSGYRDALIDKQWFWHHPNQFVYFWFVTAILLAVGSVVFKRLKVHFADVL